MRPGARTVLASSGGVDDYLLSLVRKQLCAALRARLGGAPARIDGLPDSVIRTLPADVLNVVPRDVLATATIRCKQRAAAPGAHPPVDETKVLAMLARTGLLATDLAALALLLLAAGALLRHRGALRARTY
jgi:hypothetical protein